MIVFLGSAAAAPDWWVAWIPLLGSALVAIGAYYGIRKNSESNQKTIEASNEREYDKWQRETLIRLCEEASTAQRDIDRRYNREAVTTDSKWEAYQDSVWMSTRKLGSIADSFTILGADNLNDKCVAMQKAAYAVAGPAKVLRSQALDSPGQPLESLPGWVDHHNALAALSNSREQLIFAAAKLVKR